MSEPEVLLLLPEFKLLVSVLLLEPVPLWVPPGEVAEPVLLVELKLPELPLVPPLEFMLPLAPVVPEVELGLFSSLVPPWLFREAHPAAAKSPATASIAINLFIATPFMVSLKLLPGIVRSNKGFTHTGRNYRPTPLDFEGLVPVVRHQKFWT